MKIFSGSWNDAFRNEHMEIIIIANTETEALGLALERYPTTVANGYKCGWSIDEIDATVPSIYFISSRGF